MKNWHSSQRGWFAGILYDLMKEDKDIWLLTGDLGFKMFDKIKEDFPDRFINCGASETAMVGIAVGLALENRKPFVYTITSFFLRAAETISLYLDHENVPVRLCGAGRDDDYKDDGFSHYGMEAQKFINSAGIMEFYPESKEDVPEMVKKMVNLDNPSFISLRR